MHRCGRLELVEQAAEHISSRGRRGHTGGRHPGLGRGPTDRTRAFSQGEVAAASNYFYSTRGELDEGTPEPGRSVVILGSGPNRIGQGIEFDYCCVHAAQSFRAQGYDTVSEASSVVV